MIKIEDVLHKINNMENKDYKGMLKQISIPDFTKCVAQFSGLHITQVSDDAVAEYLALWCINKYKFYEMMGRKVMIDFHISYEDQTRNIGKKIERDLIPKYPDWAMWLYKFRRFQKNKIENSWDVDDEVSYVARHINLEQDWFYGGTTITQFFKRCLKAPDELITDIAALYENKILNGIYTMSIDPTDMMLASENPYDWKSCYRLAVDNPDSHADGCLAAVLDTTSLITYIWQNEGKFELYNTYKFQNIRYKMMREWIAIEENFTSIHFNMIYPGKSNYSDGFRSQLREVIETYVAEYLGEENLWVKSHNWSNNVNRYYEKGYSEYGEDYLYILKKYENEVHSWNVYTEDIICPCGCGHCVPDSYRDEEQERYNGDGFIYENFEEQYWCEYADGYCSESEPCRENCSECWSWRNSHPVCDLDRDEECDNVSWRYTDDGVMESNEDHCSGCPLWKYHCCHDEDPDLAREED